MYGPSSSDNVHTVGMYGGRVHLKRVVGGHIQGGKRVPTYPGWAYIPLF